MLFKLTVTEFHRPKGYTFSSFGEFNIIFNVNLLVYRVEKANPSRGGGAKSWICQADAYGLTDRQTAEIF